MIYPVFLPPNYLPMRSNIFLYRGPTLDDRFGVRSLGLASAAVGGGRARAAGHRPGIGPNTVAHENTARVPLRILVHAHHGLHIVELVRVLRDLQSRTLISYGVVVAHDPLFLHTEQIGEVRADPRHEDGARFLGGRLKVSVEGRQKLVLQESIRRRHVRQARQHQLFRQPILERPEHALEPARASGE